MASTMTFEQLEELVEQMPAQAQLKLVSHITGRLTASPTVTQATSASVQREREARAETILALCDVAAERFVGESDAAENIRQMRKEYHR